MLMKITAQPPAAFFPNLSALMLRRADATLEWARFSYRGADELREVTTLAMRIPPNAEDHATCLSEDVVSVVRGCSSLEHIWMANVDGGGRSMSSLISYPHKLKTMYIKQPRRLHVGILIYFDNLTRLTLTHTRLDANVINALFSTRQLPKLKEFGFRVGIIETMNPDRIKRLVTLRPKLQQLTLYIDQRNYGRATRGLGVMYALTGWTFPMPGCACETGPCALYLEAMRKLPSFTGLLDRTAYPLGSISLPSQAKPCTLDAWCPYWWRRVNITFKTPR